MEVNRNQSFCDGLIELNGIMGVLHRLMDKPPLTRTGLNGIPDKRSYTLFLQTEQSHLLPPSFLVMILMRCNYSAYPVACG